MNEFEEVFQSRNDESKKEADKKWARFKRERELDDLAWILSDERGRRFIWRLLGICNVNSSIFYGDALQDARNNGMQTVGALVQKDVIEIGGYKIFDQLQADYITFMGKEREFGG